MFQVSRRERSPTRPEAIRILAPAHRRGRTLVPERRRLTPGTLRLAPASAVKPLLVTALADGRPGKGTQNSTDCRAFKPTAALVSDNPTRARANQGARHGSLSCPGTSPDSGAVPIAPVRSGA